MGKTENNITASAMLANISGRIRRYRIDYPLTQQELAEKAGISLRSLQNFEQGRDIRTESFIKILMALDLSDHLNALLPDPDDRPSAYFNRSQGHMRQRVSRRKNNPPATGFRWGDEG